MKNIPIIIFLVVVALCFLFTPTGYVVFNDNTKMVVNNNYFPQAHMLINDAEKSVHVIMFQIRKYGAEELIDDLIRARERGLDVKVLIEGGEDFLGKSFYEKQKKACEYLKENGIEIRKDKKGITTHAKLIIADNSVLIGSTNWNYYSFEKNNEANVLITSQKLAEDFENYFSALWNKSEEGC